MNFFRTRSIDLEDTADHQPSLLLQKLYTKSWVRLHIRLNCSSKFKAIPGLSRHAHTISFTLVDYPGYVMTARGNEMYGDIRPRSSRKAAPCTFFPMPNLWFRGYISYESTEKAAHYIRIRDNLLFMEKYDGTRDFKEDASFVMNDRQTSGLGAYMHTDGESVPVQVDEDNEEEDEEDSSDEDHDHSSWIPSERKVSVVIPGTEVHSPTPTNGHEGAIYQMDSDLSSPMSNDSVHRIIRRSQNGGKLSLPSHEVTSRFGSLQRRHSESSMPLTTIKRKGNIPTSGSAMGIAAFRSNQQRLTEESDSDATEETARVDHTSSSIDERQSLGEFSPLLHAGSRLLNLNTDNYTFTFLDSDSEGELWGDEYFK